MRGRVNIMSYNLPQRHVAIKYDISTTKLLFFRTSFYENTYGGLLLLLNRDTLHTTNNTSFLKTQIREQLAKLN